MTEAFYIFLEFFSNLLMQDFFQNRVLQLNFLHFSIFNYNFAVFVIIFAKTFNWIYINFILILLTYSRCYIFSLGKKVK